MKHLIIGNGSLGIASHIAHTQTLDNKPIIVVGGEEEKGINTELPQLIQNIIESAESYDLTQYEELNPLSGREKRRQRRKQERKRK